MLAGQPHSVVVSMHTGYGGYTPQLAVFDDGVSRPDKLLEGGGGAYFIQASQDASTLYVVNVDGLASDNSTYSQHPITASGIGPALTNISGYSSDFKIEGDTLFTDAGQALNILSGAQGNFPVSGFVAPDIARGLVYFLVQGGSVAYPTWTLTACSTNMVDTTWQITVPQAIGTAYSFIRCGADTFAFATLPYYGNPNATNFYQLFIVHTSVVPPAGDLVLGVATNWSFAGGNLTNTFTILNDGPYNATGVSFSNVLTSGSTFVMASSTQGSCAQTNGIVTCAVGSMVAGATVTITVVASIPVAGTIPVQASVSKNEPELDTSNNQISLTEVVYPPPSISVSNLSVYRENGLAATFHIVLASSNALPVSLYCATANGSALASRDYVPSSTTLTIPPGGIAANFSVPIQNNGLVESNVAFFLNVGLAPSAQPLATATCTLINLNFYSFTATNITLTPSSGHTTDAVFYVKLSGTNYTTASVDYFTRDGSAASGRDYLSKAGTLVFPAGVTIASVSVPVFQTADHTSKIFYLILANPVNGNLAVPQASASILGSSLTIQQSQLLSDGRFQLLVNGGVSGQTYSLLASTNLVDWIPISTFTDAKAPVIVDDVGAALYPQRFYRIGP
jgi:uncharacterized repeat protein (TIGR01451 family)